MTVKLTQVTRAQEIVSLKARVRSLEADVKDWRLAAESCKLIVESDKPYRALLADKDRVIGELESEVKRLQWTLRQLVAAGSDHVADGVFYGSPSFTKLAIESATAALNPKQPNADTAQALADAASGETTRWASVYAMLETVLGKGGADGD